MTGRRKFSKAFKSESAGENWYGGGESPLRSKARQSHYGPELCVGYPQGSGEALARGYVGEV